jgi:hypothetical protein
MPMIRLLRRARLLPFMLLLATPGLGGAWLQAVHPCPVDTPWLAEHQQDQHASHHGTESGSIPTSQSCHCVGACHIAGAALLSTAAKVAALVVAGDRPVSTPAPDLDPPVQLSTDRQPPATAPPLA